MISNICKRMKFSGIALRLCIIFSVTSVDNKCFNNKDCKSCVEDRTWAGRPCRWCVLDRACHTTWSPKNHCIKGLNIKDPLQCELYYRRTNLGEYDPKEAYKLAMFSALAYSDTPELCLREVFPNSDYQIVSVNLQPCDDFLFDYDNKCMQFVAVSQRNGEIVVAFRGTRGVKQIVDQVLMIIAIPAVSSTIGGRVQAYFQNVHDKLFAGVYQTVMSMKHLFPDFTVKFTGHSLGGAVAAIASAHMVKEKMLSKENVVLYTFGMPRVGDKRFAQMHDHLVPNSWRVVREGDIVARLPICKLASCTRFNGPYHHRWKVSYSGENMNIDSEFLICKGNEDSSNECEERSRQRRHLFTGVMDAHKNYFDIPIGTFCRDYVLKNLSMTTNI
ncbi:hypothetical protein DPMN_105334 [Dreissena polymorpha]|uniref:Fungal lipase-type domain-containing protein n=1 Tax=Dreissena polymorpha TaxID=45954 RepID=A0A9D4HBF1_DREPO|nr:hypothetical protein DPMN_105334 [Dreissena polymorpha]